MFIKSSLLSGKMLFLRRLLAFLIIATVAFIFTQSMLPPERIEEESEAVVGAINGVISDDGVLADFAEENISEIAHFAEFSLLGFLVSLYVCLYSKRRMLCAFISMLFASATAYFDETIQIFSGRNYDVRDMQLDILGFSAAYCIIYILYSIIKKGKINGKNN